MLTYRTLCGSSVLSGFLQVVDHDKIKTPNDFKMKIYTVEDMQKLKAKENIYYVTSVLIMLYVSRKL